jgi:hypothetical protein
MERESIEDMRRRLLRDEQVQDLIKMRAYEIYQLRGSQPGQDAENWFRAENEILTFLIQEEARGESYSHDLGPSEEGPAFEPQTTPEIADRLDQTPGQLAEERAESQSALGVWSPAEPASAEPAPSTEKKTRSRSTSKSAEPRKRKSAEPKEGAEKKPAARRVSSKKATEGESKPKRK